MCDLSCKSTCLLLHFIGQGRPYSYLPVRCTQKTKNKTRVDGSKRREKSPLRTGTEGAKSQQLPPTILVSIFSPSSLKFGRQKWDKKSLISPVERNFLCADSDIRIFLFRILFQSSFKDTEYEIIYCIYANFRRGMYLILTASMSRLGNYFHNRCVDSRCFYL